MNNVYLISILFLLIYLIVVSKKSFHMLQQNWYNDGNRYLKWINNNKKLVFFSYGLFLFIPYLVSLFLKGYIVIIVFVLTNLIVAYFLKQHLKKEQSKKPLVFTSRIKRLTFTMSLIYLIPIIYIYFTFDSSSIGVYYLVIAGLSYFNYHIVWISNILNQPAEKCVYLYYKLKAAKKLRGMSNMKTVAVTGSYGKTSTKNIVSDILNVKYLAFPTPQNFNTNYGLIRTINEYIDKYNDYFIAELGAFRRGDIKSRASIVKPTYGILTKIGTAHMETFGSQENVQKGKFELIEFLPKDGLAVLNMDDELQVNYKLKNQVKVVWYAIDNKDADVVASNITYSHEGMQFDVTFKGDKKKHSFTTKLLGNANVYNILAGILLGHELGLTIDQLQKGVAKIRTIEHRLELKRHGRINYIDDAYNSNPVGSKMALDVLNLMPGKKIVITPGMIELGEQQYDLNYKFGTYISEVADLTILVGEKQTKPIADGILKSNYDKNKLIITNDVKEAIKIANEFTKEDVYILLENDLPDAFNEK